ncbi:MAG: aminopeptidase [Bacteroidota bacterium]
MARAFKLLLLWLAIGTVIWLAFNYRMVAYGLMQLKGQVHVIRCAQPIDEVLNDPNFPDSLKHNLRRLDSFRRFAIDSLGLTDHGQYQKLYDQGGKPVLWVITASAPFRLEAYTWSFPFLGELEYKGFFDESRASEEREELLGKGLDVGWGTAGAWSTLGWFNDPLLSGMLDRSEGAFAELIIHEMSHGTVFIPGDTEASENLATFIGEEGALRYLRNRYGMGSNQEESYTQEREDEERVGLFMQRSADELDSLYRQLPENASIAEKREAKRQAFNRISAAFDALELNQPERYGRLRKKLSEANNTVVLSYVRYRSGQQDLAQELERRGGNLREVIDSLAKAH